MYSRARGYLPHIIQQRSIYFVTFRLADSLPASILFQYKEEAAREFPTFPKKASYRYQEAVQKYLDASYGQCWLKDTQIASIVSNAIRYFNHQRYKLLAWTIMPNHVHVIFRLMGEFSVSSILHS